jgi:hypothetical protein
MSPTTQISDPRYFRNFSNLYHSVRDFRKLEAKAVPTPTIKPIKKNEVARALKFGLKIGNPVQVTNLRKLQREQAEIKSSKA